MTLSRRTRIALAGAAVTGAAVAAGEVHGVQQYFRNISENR